MTTRLTTRLTTRQKVNTKVKMNTVLEAGGLYKDVIDLIAEKIHNMYIKDITTNIHLSEFERSLIESDGDFSNTNIITVSNTRFYCNIFICVITKNKLSIQWIIRIFFIYPIGINS